MAAMAEHMAYLFWATETFLCQRRQVLVGANMCPPRHMLPKAPWPERWVPPPLTRGILATARPVPHDSAEVWWPAKDERNVGELSHRKEMLRVWRRYRGPPTKQGAATTPTSGSLSHPLGFGREHRGRERGRGHSEVQ